MLEMVQDRSTTGLLEEDQILTVTTATIIAA
jgi:hypothetical protein